MRQLLNKWKTDNYAFIDRILLFFIASTIPFTLSLGNIAIICSAIFSVLTLKHRIKSKISYNSIALYLPFIYFIIVLISAITSNNINSGFRLVDKSLFFILIPFIILSFQNTIDIKKTLNVFAYATFFATIILIFYSTYNAIFYKSIDKLFFHEFTSLFDQHPVYFSTYQALSVFVLTYASPNKSSEKRLNSIIISLLIIGVFLSASKAVIFIFIIMYFYQLFVKYKKNIKRRILIIGFYLSSIVLLLFIPKVNNRFVEGLHFDLRFKPTNDVAQAQVFKYDDKHLISDLEIRFMFSSIGLYHFIDDDKLLFGYGVGDVQNYLDYYYMQYGLAPKWYEGYNLHNQYLQILISCGLLAFLFFILYLIYHLKCAIKGKDQLFIMFLIITMFVFLFESSLMRNKGVVFFVFFSSLFLINTLSNENWNIRNQGRA